MKTLETGKDKIQKICDALRTETLGPAKQEAREIVENAHLEAASIVREAREKVQQLIQSAEEEIAQKQKALATSLQMACRQAVDQLKEQIEREMFFKQLQEIVVKETADPKFIADLVGDFMKMLGERGIDEEIAVLIPKTASKKAINSLIASQFLEKLQGKSVALGEFEGGVQMKLKGRTITIDISDQALRELLASFLRSDFRQLVFQV